MRAIPDPFKKLGEFFFQRFARGARYARWAASQPNSFSPPTFFMLPPPLNAVRTKGFQKVYVNFQYGYGLPAASFPFSAPSFFACTKKSGREPGRFNHLSVSYPGFMECSDLAICMLHMYRAEL